jgi:hypothetical protein
MVKRGRKAQGLSVQNIVIIVLVLLVLIVMSWLLFSRYSKARQEIGVVTNPIEYQAACLAAHRDDMQAYQACVEQCREAAEKKIADPRCRLKENE